MGEFSKVERDGHVLIVTLNRPERMNALHSPAHYELDTVWNEFEADPDLWVGVLTGAGERAFSAGNDLKYQASGGKMGGPKSGFAGLTARFDNSKPVIAAVNGLAMGGGFEIALACDLIIASENAIFALPEPRVGLAALAGGIHRLPREIGMKQAMGMLLTGRRVPAAEGQQLGFVNEVVPKGQALRLLSSGPRKFWNVHRFRFAPARRPQCKAWRRNPSRPRSKVGMIRLRRSMRARILLKGLGPFRKNARPIGKASSASNRNSNKR